MFAMIGTGRIKIFYLISRIMHFPILKFAAISFLIVICFLLHFNNFESIDSLLALISTDCKLPEPECIL